MTAQAGPGNQETRVWANHPGPPARPLLEAHTGVVTPDFKCTSGSPVGRLPLISHRILQGDILAGCLQSQEP